MPSPSRWRLEIAAPIDMSDADHVGGPGGAGHVKVEKCRICARVKPLTQTPFWGWLCSDCKDATEGKK